MPLAQLKVTLEKVVGEEEIKWVIPYPFLPPRYQKICKGRNMLLVIDLDCTVHVRWEGARKAEWCSLTAGETKQLVSQVARRVVKYHEELGVLREFVDGWIEPPFQDPAQEEGLSPSKEEKKATKKEYEVVDGRLLGSSVRK